MRGLALCVAAWVALCGCVPRAQEQELHLAITAPAEFAHESVIVIDDPTSKQELSWVGGKAQLEVPKSGVVRIKTLGPASGREIDVTLNGKRLWGSHSFPLRGKLIAVYNFAEVAREPDPGLMSEAERVRFIEERENEM